MRHGTPCSTAPSTNAGSSRTSRPSTRPTCRGRCVSSASLRFTRRASTCSPSRRNEPGNAARRRSRTSATPCSRSSRATSRRSRIGWSRSHRDSMRCRPRSPSTAAGSARGPFACGTRSTWAPRRRCPPCSPRWPEPASTRGPMAGRRCDASRLPSSVRTRRWTTTPAGSADGWRTRRRTGRWAMNATSTSSGCARSTDSTATTSSRSGRSSSRPTARARRAAALEVDRHATEAEVIDRIKRDHPATFELALEGYRDAMFRARRHIIDHGLVTLPRARRSRSRPRPNTCATPPSRSRRTSRRRASTPRRPASTS